MSPIKTTSVQSNCSYLDTQNSKYLSKQKGSCKSPITKTLLATPPSEILISLIISCSALVNLSL